MKNTADYHVEPSNTINGDTLAGVIWQEQTVQQQCTSSALAVYQQCIKSALELNNF